VQKCIRKKKTFGDQFGARQGTRVFDNWLQGLSCRCRGWRRACTHAHHHYVASPNGAAIARFYRGEDYVFKNVCLLVIQK